MGSAHWLAVYLVCSLGGTIMSCVLDPDRISVTISGALMGLFGAKLSEFLIFALFDTERKCNQHHGEQMRLEQLSSDLCNIAIVSIFSFIPLVDWSGHIGGILSRCTMGIFLFSKPIQSQNLR
jgi:membrane associated rhomboid family serine protease